MLNQIQPAGLLVGSACGPVKAAPRNDSFNMLYLKNVLQLKNLLDMGKITQGDLQPSFQIYGVHQTKQMLPERNAYSADVPTNLEERHVEGGILDQFWMVLDGFWVCGCLQSFLSWAAWFLSENTEAPIRWQCCGLDWFGVKKNARFSHAIHRRHEARFSWFAFLFVEIIAPLKLGHFSISLVYRSPKNPEALDVCLQLANRS